MNSPPPLYHPLVDQDGKTDIFWSVFFNQLFTGDAGTEWFPTFQNLTIVGAFPTITGRVYQISQFLTFFSLNIIPGTNTSAVAGTTFIDNFPLIMRADGINFAVAGRLGTNSGMCEKVTNKIWVPAWTTVTVPLSIIGIVEAS